MLAGIQQGTLSVFRGFSKGIIGVFLKPIQGFREEGGSGAIKGAIKGVAGLAIMPVTGILDFASKTT